MKLKKKNEEEKESINLYQNKGSSAAMNMKTAKKLMKPLLQCLN